MSFPITTEIPLFLKRMQCTFFPGYICVQRLFAKDFTAVLIIVRLFTSNNRIASRRESICPCYSVYLHVGQQITSMKNTTGSCLFHYIKHQRPS